MVETFRYHNKILVRSNRCVFIQPTRISLLNLRKYSTIRYLE